MPVHTAKNEVYLLTYLKQGLYPVFEILVLIGGKLQQQPRIHKNEKSND